MIDIGSNLDRVTCWQDRTGPAHSNEEKNDLMKGLGGLEKEDQEEEDLGGCEFLRKEVERDECWRKYAAKVASMILLIGNFTLCSLFFYLSYLYFPNINL